MDAGLEIYPTVSTYLCGSDHTCPDGAMGSPDKYICSSGLNSDDDAPCAFCPHPPDNIFDPSIPSSGVWIDARYALFAWWFLLCLLRLCFGLMVDTSAETSLTIPTQTPSSTLLPYLAWSFRNLLERPLSLTCIDISSFRSAVWTRLSQLLRYFIRISFH